ncbi:hypothetical protein SprV_0301141000 [Sparganum proliferum]
MSSRALRKLVSELDDVQEVDTEDYSVQKPSIFSLMDLSTTEKPTLETSIVTPKPCARKSNKRRKKPTKNSETRKNVSSKSKTESADEDEDKLLEKAQIPQILPSMTNAIIMPNCKKILELQPL